ncbi:ATP-binding protein [Paratractidigestivibacter sp.]|uniref:ATP-binding protein n=2 Tax=Paratractidigestivibacter sp. TaxID=2847316 RepID=UPI002AC96627|nr:ATP-binding protein [Paratractidigestivibacter sp.]
MDAETFEAIVERLRKQGTDDGEFEVKESAVKLSSDIWETVSAFANTTGGVIILGLSERNDFTPVDNFDRAAVEGASEADFGKTLIARTFDRAYDLAPRSMKGADNNWERLERLNFIDEKGHVTKAGLLAAGSYPQQFFPRLVVDVEVHPGLEKGTPGAPRFTDRTVCEGTIGEMVADAVAAIAKNLHRRSIVVGASRIDELEIPEEVIREAVANALVHRDYSPRHDGQAVSVDIFDDRLEILNPGGLYGTKTRENLADGASCCRNATLMKLMSLVPLPAGAGLPAEGNGSGVPMMIRECEQRGIRAPEFRPALDSFKVVLARPTYEGGDSKLRAYDGKDLASVFGPDEELSSKEIQERTGLSIGQVRYRVRTMVESGELAATAATTSRDRRYRLA